MYVSVKDLPAAVTRALATVKYGRPDIQVTAAPRVVLGDRGVGNGYRAFLILVSLSSGEHTVTWGSWGGANMFDRTNAVDNDTNAYELPADGVAVTGYIGGTQPTYANIYIPASMVDRMLPARGEELPTSDLDALYCHKALKGGSYRREALQRAGITAVTLDSLVDRGLLSRNKAGAMAITTAGKNALGTYRNYAIG